MMRRNLLQALGIRSRVLILAMLPVVVVVMLLGYNLRRATAGTKVLNFTSNIASLLIFAAAGQVVWQVGLPMGLAQMAGAWLGSHLVMRHGTRLIRPLLVIVSLAISIRLLLAE